MNQPQRKNIIIIAYGCDGTDVGESLSSFNIVKHISKFNNVTLLTMHKKNHLSIALQLPETRVIEIEDIKLFRKYERFNSMLKPGYLKFYRYCRRWIKQEIKHGSKIDIIHQLSPFAMRYPSPGADLGIPFIIGPSGGGLAIPKGLETKKTNSAWYTKLRKVDSFRLKYDPFLRNTFETADQILVASPHNKINLKFIHNNKYDFMSEMGVDQISFNRTRVGPRHQVNFLFVGRIVRTKGLLHSLLALKKINKRVNWHFDIIGEGNDRLHCENEVKNLCLKNNVTFHGKIKHDLLDKFYTNADIFLFPSFRETTGGVLIEALSFGVPCICTNFGGPGYIVGDNCGIKIDHTDSKNFISNLTNAINELSLSFELRDKYSRNALKWVSDYFLWEAKATRINVMYDRTILNFNINSQQILKQKVAVS